jgi:hypothetical protein
MRPQTASGPHFWIRVTHQCHALFETTGVYLVMEAAEVFGAPDRADAGP